MRPSSLAVGPRGIVWRFTNLPGRITLLPWDRCSFSMEVPMIHSLRFRRALDWWPYPLLTISVVGLAYNLWVAVR